MKLTPERFAQIMDGLRCDGPTGRNAERRASPRVGLRAQVLIAVRRVDGSIARSLVWTRDLSPRGLSFVYTESIAEGARFLAHLEGPDGNTDVVYRVVFCKQGADGGIYNVRARFESFATGSADA